MRFFHILANDLLDRLAERMSKRMEPDDRLALCLVLEHYFRLNGPNGMLSTSQCLALSFIFSLDHRNGSKWAGGYEFTFEIPAKYQ